MDHGQQRSHWDEVFSCGRKFEGGPSALCERALGIFEHEGARTVLEIGCGQGRDTSAFLSAGLEVIALDYSHTGCSQTLEAGADVIMADVTEGIPMTDGSVDACYSHMLLTMDFRRSEIRSILAELSRVLRSGGVNVLSFRDRSDQRFGMGTHVAEDIWDWNGFHVHYLDHRDVARMAEGQVTEAVWHFVEGDPPKRLTAMMLRKD